MSKKEKIWIGILLIILAVVIIGVVIATGKRSDGELQNTQPQNQANEEKYTTELNDGTKINTSDELKKKKKYGDLEISNIQYTEKDGMTVLLADVKNTGTTTHESEVVKITILGEQGETLAETKPILGKVEPGQTIKLNASFIVDVSNAKDFKIEAYNN